MTRTGKIARLPREIRQQLNQRLCDGHQAKSLLPWLNSLPEVRAIMDAQFDGRSISAGNLTEWKNGGYREWQASQHALQFFENLQDKHTLGHKYLSGPLTAKLAHWAALHFAAMAHSIILGADDQQTKWARLRELCADIARLRRGDLYAERISLDREWLALEQSNSAVRRDEEFWKWTEREDIREKLYPEGEGLTPETLEKIERELRLM